MEFLNGEPRFKKRKRSDYTFTGAVSIPVPGQQTIIDTTFASTRRGLVIANQTRHVVRGSQDQRSPPTSSTEIAVEIPISPVISPLMPRASQGMSNLMKEFVAEETLFVDALARGYTHPDIGLNCMGRNHNQPVPALFRCINCVNPPLLCRDCIRDMHHHTPLHRIQTWNGQFFEPTTLKECGLIINLGHGGNLCPQHDPSDSFTEVSITTIDGFQKAVISYCYCPARMPPLDQLVNAGFWPATIKQPTTLFTKSMLEDLHLHSLTSRKSTWDYWGVLRRKTNAFFPEKVPNVYSQLLRCTRFFRYISTLFQSGQSFGLDQHLNTQRRPGLVSMPCLACPEPGFNMPDGWEDTPDNKAFIHRLFLHQDANFRNQLKVKTKRDPDDISLFNGHGFYPCMEEFNEYLRKTTLSEEKSECSNFKAVTLQNILKFKYMSVSGIMAIICRHDCFRPGGQNDLQKGERYANADYALAGALTWIPIPKQVALSYDIVCQYTKKISQRFRQYFPSLVSAVQSIHYAIPKKHIVGHQEECQIRWSCNYLEGFGRVYGEGIEAVWAEDNQQSSSLREMNAGHRHDVIEDNHMDWNIRKNQRLGQSTYDHYVEAVEEYSSSLLTFRAITDTLPPATIEQWRRENAKPQKDSKGIWESIYKIRIAKQPTQSQIANRLVQDQLKNDINLLNPQLHILQQQSLVSFIQLGMQLQVIQYDLCVKIKFASDNPESRDQREIETTRSKLAIELQRWIDELFIRFPQLAHGLQSFSSISEAPETAIVGLPSDFPTEETLHLTEASQIEMELREGQANDSLVALREEIRAEVSLRSQKRTHAFGTGPTTRASNLLQRQIRQKLRYADLYIQARNALIKLNAFELKPHLGQQFLELNKQTDLWMKDPTKILNLGDSRRDESWIWKVGTNGFGESLDWCLETDRVNWHKKRADVMRWREEIFLREADFDRIHRGNLRLSEAWNSMAQSMSDQANAGKRAYCAFIGNYYRSRAIECDELWTAANKHLEQADVDLEVPL